MFKIIGADQKEYGPISVAQIRQWITDGRLNAQTQAQREGSGDWQPLSTFDEFADIFNPGASTSSPAYASPPMAAPGFAPMDPASHDIALRAVKGPAIALIVAAALGIAIDLLGAVIRLLGRDQEMYQNMRNLSPQMRSLLLHFQGGSGAMINLFGVALNLFVLFGALKMMRLQNFNLVLAACIVAMLPCTGCCCILGLPFAIWALVVINKPEVKSQFS